jgi:glucose uptake protein GlcU
LPFFSKPKLSLSSASELTILDLISGVSFSIAEIISHYLAIFNGIPVDFSISIRLVELGVVAPYRWLEESRFGYCPSA